MKTLLTIIEYVPAVLIGAALMAIPACIYGQRTERQVAAVAAGKEAVRRIGQLEKNNAHFKDLSARDRCLVFMRDSGLPEQECD